MRALKVTSLFVLAAIAVSACGSSTPTSNTGAATSASGASAATSAPAASTEDIKVAILAPLSGPVPTFGVSTRDGALLAIEEWNAKGGVLGRKIVPVVEDSQCTPDPALNAAKKVVEQDKVKFIIGEVCSKATIPVADYANSKKVIQITPTSTNPSVTVDSNGKVKDYIFRACFIDPFQGQVGAKFALDTLKAKTAFIMLDQSNDYVKGLAEYFEKSFTAGGGTIVGKETYTSKDTDFSAILAKVADAKPDVIYLPDYYNIVNLAAKQAKEKGITAPFMGGDGWDSPDLDLKAADGGFYTNHYSPDDTRAEVQGFVKSYGSKYKDDKQQAKVPDALAALAYDATNILLQGITEAKTADDTAAVRDALAKISFSGISGKITYDQDHNPVKSATILQVKDNKVSFNSVVNP